MSPHLRSDALHGRVRSMIRAFVCGDAPPESFDAIAVDLVAFQAERVPGYARLCAARGVDPRSISRASEAPAVPAEAFKMASVFAFDAREAIATFRTSGTTLGARGAHAMRETGSYDAAALAFGGAMFAPDLTEPRVPRPPVLVIGPSRAEAPDSSLTHMCALFARTLGASQEGSFFVRSGVLEVGRLRARVASLPREGPAIVLATSFALVHLLEDLGSGAGSHNLALPSGSRVMQTGGFKGRSREVSSAELRRDVARVFSVDERAVVAEYGMTELSSQFWEATLVDDRARHGFYAEPPWARVVPVDPATLAPVPDGAVGIARIEDLANVDSAFAILTHDRVRRAGARFELLGREPGASPRGCSIALDEMLSASAAKAADR